MNGDTWIRFSAPVPRRVDLQGFRAWVTETLNNTFDLDLIPDVALIANSRRRHSTCGVSATNRREKLSDQP
jgi:hypothetical protein